MVWVATGHWMFCLVSGHCRRSFTTDRPYQELGGDYFARLNPERAKQRITRQANALALTVTFQPIATTI